MASDWEVELVYQVTNTQHLGGDGLAFWYVKDPNEEGPVFGSRDRWVGLGVFVDTYDNDRRNDNPYISVVLNDGTLSYNPATDGSDIQVGGCRASVRRTAHPAGLLVRYDGTAKKLDVEYHTGDGAWQHCFSKDQVDLPVGYHFGVSAATGQLADVHDVFRFTTRRLRDSAPAVEAKPTATNAATNAAATSEKKPVAEEKAAAQTDKEKDKEKPQSEPEPSKPADTEQQRKIEELKKQLEELQKAVNQQQQDEKEAAKTETATQQDKKEEKQPEQKDQQQPPKQQEQEQPKQQEQEKQQNLVTFKVEDIKIDWKTTEAGKQLLESLKQMGDAVDRLSSEARKLQQLKQRVDLLRSEHEGMQKRLDEQYRQATAQRDTSGWADSIKQAISAGGANDVSKVKDSFEELAKAVHALVQRVDQLEKSSADGVLLPVVFIVVQVVFALVLRAYVVKSHQRALY